MSAPASHLPDPHDKGACRRALRSRLRGIGDTHAASAAIRSHLAAFLREKPASCLASFAAIPGEPDLLPLIDELPRHRWALPQIIGQHLRLADAAALSQLATGPYGIREPQADAPSLDPAEIDIFLCPGLGFTPSGTRLGRGKGYYDRTLAEAAPQTLRIGIAFSEQIVDALPTEPHDLPMTHLITPDGLLTI